MEEQAEIEKAREKEYEGYMSGIDNLWAFIFKHVPNFNFDLIAKSLKERRVKPLGKLEWLTRILLL